MGARQVRLKGRAAALLDIVGLFGAAVEPAQEPAAPSATAHHTEYCTYIPTGV